jgi:hypothetical protein
VDQDNETDTILFPAQFSPLAWGQGPVVRPTTPDHTRRPHETPSSPTLDSTNTGGGYPHSPLLSLSPAQFSPLARGQGPIVRLDPPRALHGFFGSHPQASPTYSTAHAHAHDSIPSNADTPTPNHTRRPHETPSFPTFDSADTRGGYPHSPLLFPAQFSPLARGQGAIVRLDPPRALHGFFVTHPRTTQTTTTPDGPPRPRRSPLLTPLTLEGVIPIPLYFFLHNFLPWHGARDL